MKVWELIEKLADAPASAEVRVTGAKFEDTPNGDLIGVEVDGSDRHAIVTLEFSEDPEEE